MRCFTWQLPVATLSTSAPEQLPGAARAPGPVRMSACSLMLGSVHAQTRSPVDHAVPSAHRTAAPAPSEARLRVPGDKSISHRALIFGALTVGETQVSGLLEGEDVHQHRQGHAGAGRARVERTGEGAWRVRGVGVGGLREPHGARSISAIPAPVAAWSWGRSAGCPITATFDGDASLRKRPMRRMLDPLSS